MQLSKKSTLTIVLTDKLLLKIEKLGTASKRNIEIQDKITQLTKANPCWLSVEKHLILVDLFQRLGKIQRLYKK